MGDLKGVLGTLSSESAERLFQLGTISQHGLNGLAIEFYQLSGNPDAMYELGKMYHKGEGDIEPDLDLAVAYYLQAVEEGHVQAMYELASLYATTDLQQAITFFKQAAERGYAPAMHTLGNMYYTNSDFVQAVEYFTSAAKAGNITAAYNVAVIYHHGEGNVQADIEKAVIFYQQAADAGDNDAAYSLGVILNLGQGGVSKDMQRSLKYYKQAADGGNIAAMHNAGVLLSNNEGDIDIDWVTAIDYFKQAAQAGLINSITKLAGIYYTGNEVVSSDISKALYYFKIAADQGHVNSMYNIGVICCNGEGNISIDMEKAIEYYGDAAAHGHIEAAYRLGSLYHKGENGIPINMVLAIQYYEQAAEKSHAKASYSLAVVYHQGDGVAVNMDKAVDFYEKAAQQGHLQALYNLGNIFSEGRFGVAIDVDTAMMYYRTGAGHVSKRRTGSLEDYADVWVGQWCWYRLGEIYLELEQLDDAKTAFENCMSGGTKFPQGYVGLAKLEDDETLKINYLMKAADEGIAEAWEELISFVDHPYLLQYWLVDNISILKAMVNSRKPHSCDGIIFCFQSQPECSICKQEQRLYLQDGIYREPRQIPSTHIDSTCIELLKGKDTYSPLGKGGEGEVIISKMKLSDGAMKNVALKRRFDFDYDENFKDTRELRYLQLMQSNTFDNHIIQCFGHTVMDDVIYVVMESAHFGDMNLFLLQPSVQEYMIKSNSLGLLMKWMFEIASGLSAMHSLKVQHGDVKPHNVLVFEGLHLKLTDLGFSKRALSAQYACGDYDINTENGIQRIEAPLDVSISNVQGSPAYMAPELHVNCRPTIESDMFSYGVTCLHIINGKLFRREIVNALQQAGEKFMNFGQVEVTDAVISMIRDCLSDSRTKRPTSKECLLQLSNLMQLVTEDEDDIIKLISGLHLHS